MMAAIIFFCHPAFHESSDLQNSWNGAGLADIVPCRCPTNQMLAAFNDPVPEPLRAT